MRLGLLTALVLVVGAMPLPWAEAVIRPETLYHERPVAVGPVTPGFPVEWVGVVFDQVGSGHVDHDRLAVRFRQDGAWGPWHPVEEDGAQAAGRFTGALVAADGADAYQVRGVPAGARNARAAALNTTDGPPVVVGHRPAGAAEASTPCRSRADWGADEDLRTDIRAYAPLQMATVHHTATDNDAAATDPDGIVRAIYRYHTQTNGWDDIGYQTLIAPDGTLYEGRWSGSTSRSCLYDGGDGSDFGHRTTDADADVVTGAHTGGYNTGNFGVSLLGTFTDVAPSSAARDTLVGYLAELAGRHGLDPTATVNYDNGVKATTADAISGHRDLSATQCPGGVLYADLPRIRTDVAVALAGTPDEPVDTVVDDVASGEQTVLGDAAGTYRDTWTAGAGIETLTERESGGKPSRRTSELDHVWTVPVTGGDSVTLVVDAAATDVGDGDGFAFALSTDGGATYDVVLTVPAGTTGIHTAALPDATSGPVHVRVTDTDRTSGNRSLDSLVVDHLYVRSETGTSTAPPPEPEPDPAGIDVQAVARKVKGEHVVDLSWSGATDVDVTRDGATVFTGAGTAFTDEIGAKGAATYTYVVCTSDGTTCSDPLRVVY